MRYVLTISAPEPAAPFLRFVARFADGGELRARGLVAAKLPFGKYERTGTDIYAHFSGAHRLTFILNGGSIELLCADLPEIVPASAVAAAPTGGEGGEGK